MGQQGPQVELEGQLGPQVELVGQLGHLRHVFPVCDVAFLLFLQTIFGIDHKVLFHQCELFYGAVGLSFA